MQFKTRTLQFLREGIELLRDEAEDILYFSQQYGKEMLDSDLMLRDMSLDSLFRTLFGIDDTDAKGFVFDNDGLSMVS
jgi:hypothetical protein